MRKTVINIIFAVMALGGLESVMAQGGMDDRVSMLRREMEMTDRLLSEAREAVHASKNPFAAQAFEKAVELQKQAWGRFQNANYLMAGSLSKKARELAKSALSLSRQSEQQESAVTRRLERAAEMLNRAWEALDERQPKGLTSVLESAQVNLRRAWEFYRNGNYRPAVKLADQVERTARKIMRASGGRLSQQAQYRRRLDNVRQLLNDTRELITDCNAPAARQRFDQAQTMFRRAQEFSSNSRWRAGLEALQKAREQALKASQSCRGTGQLEVRLQRLQRQADALAEQIGSMSGARRDTARKLLKQVREQLDLARQFIGGNRPTAAQAALQGAQLSLRRLKSFISSQP